MNLFLYGPPAVGKSVVGKELAAKLNRKFFDSDSLIESRAGKSIAQIFETQGEEGFRRIEAEVCAELARHGDAVIALGGGALVNEQTRATLQQNGIVICLRADVDLLVGRISNSRNEQDDNLSNRPLLAGENPREKLEALLAKRQALYDSFPLQVNTTNKNVFDVAKEILAQLETKTLSLKTTAMEHDILIGYGLLNELPQILEERNLRAGVLVTDENVAKSLEPSALSHQPLIVVSAGEAYKNLETIRKLYDEFLKHDLDRGSIVVAVGGGVIGDMAGFAAATFMRGLRWVNVPTTLLSMVDASIGGKTGVDLPQGKNLVGAFHAPSLVIIDPLMLNTLPRREYNAGMAEVIKHGIIRDVNLFESLEAGTGFGSPAQIAQALQVKIEVVQRDPFEKGERAILNVGHTMGHGVEAASHFELRHGEAIAIGLIAEARLAERIGIAESGLADRIEKVIERFELPTRFDGDPEAVRALMQSDKKKSRGKLKFALPKKIGEAVWGIEVEEEVLMSVVRGVCGK
ncbi:MAG: 3-dehydroquinate synthase [Chloroflexota bacterium]